MAGREHDGDAELGEYDLRVSARVQRWCGHASRPRTRRMILVGLGVLVTVLAGVAASAAPALGAASRVAGGCPAEPAKSSTAMAGKAAALQRAATAPAAAAAKAARASLPVIRFRANGPAVGPTRALVGGSVAGSGPVSVLAEYGRGRSYGSCSRWQRLAASGGVAEVALKGLHPAATYHVRLVARTAAGTTFGADRTFRTLAGGHIPQGVKIGPVAVGGLSRASAISLLSRPLAAPLRLTYAGAFWRVTRAKAGARTDSTRAVTAALTAWPDQVLKPVRISVDAARLRAYLTTLEHRWNRTNRPGGVRLVGRRAVVTPVTKALEVDTRRMTVLIRRQLTSGGRQLLSLDVKTAPPTAMPPQKAVVVRLDAQTLTAYLNGKPVLTTPVTTGRPALPTPVGSYNVIFRASPFVFHSPWPPGNPFWYPPTPVTWAMDFVDGDFLHDDPGEPAGAYGAGSENGPYASHGCVHVPHDSMAFLYNWLPVGAPVIVAQQ